MSLTAYLSPPNAGTQLGENCHVYFYAYDDFGNIQSGTYSLDWGDGSAPDADSDSGFTGADHVYTAVGTYTITLTISSSATSETATISVSVQIDPVSARLYLTPSQTSPLAGAEISLTIYSYDAITTDYTVNWGDGSPHDTTTYDYAYTEFTHTFATPGTYTATATVVNSRGTASATQVFTVTAPAVNAVPTGAIELPAEEGSMQIDILSTYLSSQKSVDYTGPHTVNRYGEVGLRFSRLAVSRSGVQIKWYSYTAARDGTLVFRIRTPAGGDWEPVAVFTTGDLYVLNELYTNRYFPYTEGQAGIVVEEGKTYLIGAGIDGGTPDAVAELQWSFQVRTAQGPCLNIQTGYNYEVQAYAVSIADKNVDVIGWKASDSYPDFGCSDGASTVYIPQDGGGYDLLEGQSGFVKIKDGQWAEPAPSVYDESPIVPLWDSGAVVYNRARGCFMLQPFDGDDAPILPPEIRPRDVARRVVAAANEAGTVLDYWLVPDLTDPPLPWSDGSFNYTEQILWGAIHGMHSIGDHFWTTELFITGFTTISGGSSSTYEYTRNYDIVKYRLDPGHVATELLRFRPSDNFTNGNQYDQKDEFRHFAVNDSETRLVLTYDRDWPPGYTEPSNYNHFNTWYIGGMWVQVYDITGPTPVLLNDFRFTPYPTIPGSYLSQDGYDAYNFYAYGQVIFDPTDDNYIFMTNNGTKHIGDPAPSWATAHSTFVFRIPLYGDPAVQAAAASEPWVSFPMDSAEETPYLSTGVLPPLPVLLASGEDAKVRFTPT